MAVMDSSLSAVYIIIHLIPSALQSIFNNVSLLGSYHTSIGDDVIDTFIPLNDLISSGAHTIFGMSDRKCFLIRAQRGLIPISKYGA